MRSNATINFIGMYLLFWLVILILIPLGVHGAGYGSTLIRSLIYIGCFGGLGGVTHIIRSFYKHVFQKTFEDDSLWWYIFRPFTSIVLGIISYLLIVGGLMSLGNIAEIDYGKSIMLYCGIAFLAGFSFTQFFNKLEEIAKNIFTTSGKEDK